ncbi:MAG: aminoglycoside phosphotransferase family protein [Acetatifactor sp.]|nr:aminoglycoside phosphotransferase family protein [Acetatifactor sp.]
MEKDMLKFARALFVMHGVTDEPKRLSGGWTNCVFAAGGLVLRCTTNIESGRLRRETRLAQSLPAEVGYPEIVDSGSTDGCDWMLCRRILGTNLEDAWEKLSWDERAEALEQLWMCAKHVHAISPDTVRTFVNENLWYITTMENALREAETLKESNVIKAEQYEVVKGYIYRFEAAMKQAECVLVHGDLTPANAMWHDGKITALMDFECAAIAPKEADLMMLLNTAYECGDLSVDESDFKAKQRFNDRMRVLVEKETPDWEILQGYQAIKLIHHVCMDMNDEDFSEEHEELVSLLALLKDGKGKFSEVMP